MKRVIGLFFLSFVISVCVNVPKTMAIGIGLYVTSGSGSGNYDVDDDYNTWDVDADIQRSGYGFVLDTAVARDRIFNYQLNIGLYDWSEEFENDSELDLRGFMMSHDFGFGVVRNKYVRFWLGPEIRLAYGSGDKDDNEGYDVEMVSVGIGLVTGLNLNLGPVVSFGIKAGYLYEDVGGYADSWYDSNDYSGSDTMTFISLNLLFRINDVF